jgi:hypothetical protein
MTLRQTRLCLGSTAGIDRIQRKIGAAQKFSLAPDFALAAGWAG